MQLLYPIGLLALAGLIIPVIIHLWSVKTGKTLKIGSINLLGESANATSKSLKITDWLLFVLRCLLLIIIGLMLAQPTWQKKLTTKSNMGWVLIDQNQFAEVYPSHQKTIDSLLNLGFELHDFNLGFNQFVLKDSLQREQKSTLSYPSLFKKLNNSIPNSYAAYLFAPKRITDFSGDLPKINFQLNWIETKANDTLKTWATNFLGKDYEAKSTPTLTNYMSKSTQDLPTLTAMIYEPNGSDSKYIKAALKSITDYTKRKIEIRDFNADLPAGLTFWLSEQVIPSNYLVKLKPNSKVISYVKGKASPINSSIQLSNSEFSSIDLYQKVEGEKEKGEIIWRDGFGEPLLIKQQKDQISLYYFYSKFSPQWSDLVWNENFVNALLPIVLGDQQATGFGFENNVNDLRMVGSNQNLVLNGEKSKAIITKVENLPMSKYLWIFALVILIIERILSFRKTKISDVKN